MTTLQILRKTQDRLHQIYKAEVIMPKIEKKLVAIHKRHIKFLADAFVKDLKVTGYDQIIYNDAQSKKTGGIIQKQIDEDPDIQFLRNLFNTKDPNEWFKKSDFDEEWEKTLADAYGDMSESAFTKFGVFMEFNQTDPAIGSFLDSRMNFVKDLPQEDFDKMIRILKEGYYDKGLSSKELAKKLQASDLFEETYKGRAITIARTETSIVTGQASYQTNVDHGFVFKNWIDTMDNRVRDEHVMNAQQGNIPVNDLYQSGQLHVGAGNDPALVVNCRCAEGYSSIDPNNDKQLLLESVLDTAASIQKEDYTREETIKILSGYLASVDYQITVKNVAKTQLRGSTIHIKYGAPLVTISEAVVKTLKRSFPPGVKIRNDISKRAAGILTGWVLPSSDKQVEEIANEVVNYMKTFLR